MLLATQKSEHPLSKYEWGIIISGCLISLVLYFIFSHSAQKLTQNQQQIEVLAKVQHQLIQASLLLESSAHITADSAPYASFQKAQTHIKQLQQGGSYAGLTLQATDDPALHRMLSEANTTLKLLLESLTEIGQPPLQAGTHINLLSQQYSELEGYLYQQAQRLLKQQSHQFFSLIACTLLITGVGVMLSRRLQMQQAAHERSLQQSEMNANISKEKLQQIIEAAGLGYYDWYCDDGIYEVNHQWLQILGFPFDKTQLSVNQVLNRIHPDDYNRVQHKLTHCVESGESFYLEYRVRHHDQSWIWVESSGRAMSPPSNPQSDTDTIHIYGTLQNITERKKIEQEHRENDQRFRKLIEALPTVAVQGYDKTRNVIYWNDASTKIYGYGKHEAQGKKLEDLIIPHEMREGVVQLHSKWIEQGEEIPATELQLKHKDGHLVPVFSSHVMLKEGTDSPEMFCVDVDLTPQYKAAMELKRLASLDLLTNLPNRRYLQDELNRRIREAARFGQQLAVLFIDIDLFKEINDTMGHNAGDLLLQQVAERLRLHLREYDTLARFGGDEFVIVLPNMKSRDAAEAVSKKILSEFSSTFHLLEQDIYISASIGICVYPEDGVSCDELLKHSDTAMYQAKEAGRSRHRFFDQSMNDQLNQQRKIATELRNSLEADEFSLLFQPQINLQTQEIVSCEALLRWEPKDRSQGVSPAVFIPVAERSDLIIRLGYWVLKAACRQASRWKAQGITNLRIDINVSGKQLEQPDFFEVLLNTLNEHGLKPKDIGLELTEYALIQANQELLEQLEQLKALEMKISIDDFGTGYSSLNYLKTFPVSHLKIDRSFVTEVPRNPKDQAILEAIVEVGHKLDLSIVVEGVETQHQADFCLSAGCDLAQGYRFYKPMTASKIHSLMKASSS